MPKAFLQHHNLTDFYFAPMLDARRMEVYCLITNHRLEVVEKTQAKIIDELSFADYLLDRKILFFGNIQGLL